MTENERKNREHDAEILQAASIEELKQYLDTAIACYNLCCSWEDDDGIEYWNGECNRINAELARTHSFSELKGDRL